MQANLLVATRSSESFLTASAAVYVGCLCVGLLMGVALLVYWRRQSRLQQRAEGVIWVQALGTMLRHLQRHRGLSSSLLAGDTQLAAELLAAQQAIGSDIAKMARVGLWIEDNVHWEAICAHWAKLASQPSRLDVFQNLDQHNRLIKSILVLVDDVAESNHLATLSANGWRPLLALTEELGQIRALGLAYLGSVENGQPSHRLRNTLYALVNDLMAALEDDASSALATEVRKQVLAFLHHCPKCVLNDNETFSLQSYYQEATRLIDDLYSQVDTALQRLLLTQP